ncbi:MAG TPA: hypothetical protein IAB35_04650 [Candidatus Faecimonas gallistercoris]|nr:hypothetical protein [Candidatus Faecimonas gallistercoris]
MTNTNLFAKMNNCQTNREVLYMFYDEKQALRACEEEPSLIFDLIKEGYYHLVDQLISKNKVDINTVDVAGNDVVVRLLKAKQYDLVLKFIRKRSWNPNHQNLDGNTIGHLLVKDTSVSALKILDKLTRSKRYLLNIKNKNGETVLDRAIHNQSVFQALKILEEKSFNNIDVLSFKQLYQLCIKNNYYGKYSKLTNLENIVDSLEKKEGLVPSMRKLLADIEENMEAIKYDLMRNKYSLLDQMINTSLEEVIV